MKTTRIYLGMHAETGKPLYWTLKVKDATKSVVLNGTVEDAMKGGPGISIGCHMSNTARANATAFGHPALYISFTKTVAKVITKISRGKPTECIRYRHSYGRYVDLNDKDPSKALIKKHPELFNREFTLRPYKQEKNHWKPEYGRKETGKRGLQMMRGELARMKKAGMAVLTLD